jgi:uncharacterized protein (UPF0276 family)
MTRTRSVGHEFLQRLAQIPVHGVGLSVDVYSPDLSSLLGALQQRQVLPDYLEVFRAARVALAAIRKETEKKTRLTYHGEGLWLTQPEAADDPLFMQEACAAARDLVTVNSAWLNHECATKHMAGYSFGTYLPPLYTEAGARVVAHNTKYLQELVDRHGRLENGATPLVLLEMPPLTYFVAGTVPVPTFFRQVTDGVACGLVLDVGHLWTVYRYSGARRTSSLERFVDDFLSEFPVDRVVEIHVAGLAVHESGRTGTSASRGRAGEPLPAWTDAHAEPIPPILFDMLDRILADPRLRNLKGLALEVDTKAIEVIVDEFDRFVRRYGARFPRGNEATESLRDRVQTQRPAEPIPDGIKQALAQAYDRYARVVAGRAEPEGPEWITSAACHDELETYRSTYLPYEILRWGGDLEAMFPETVTRLHERAIPLVQFVSFWFREPRPLSGSYDFFLLKIDRFLEFIHEAAPDLDAWAEREADELRQAYEFANEPASTTASPRR